MNLNKESNVNNIEPIVNFNKKISPNDAEQDLISKIRGLPRYVHTN